MKTVCVFDTGTMELRPLFGEPVPGDEDPLHGHPSSSSSKWSPVGHGRWGKTPGNSSAELHDGRDYEPTPKEVAQWGRAVAEVSQSFRTPQQPKPCQDHQRSWKARVASATCPPTSLLSM